MRRRDSLALGAAGLALPGLPLPAGVMGCRRPPCWSEGWHMVDVAPGPSPA
jgi:hypothetical protein